MMEEEEDASDEGDETVLYILLRAADRFFTEYTRYPGFFNNNVEADIPKLKVGESREQYTVSLSN